MKNAEKHTADIAILQLGLLIVPKAYSGFFFFWNGYFYSTIVYIQYYIAETDTLHKLYSVWKF